MATLDTMVPCLICYDDSNSDSGTPDAADSREQISGDDSSVLSKDLHAIFVLKNLFEVSGEQLQTYLTQNGSPSEWAFVSFCARCREAVENAKGIYQEIVEASRIFAAVKGEIVETVKRSWKRQLKRTPRDKRRSVPETGKDDNVKIIENMREFIFKRNYGPSSDPFVDGDLIANDLCRDLTSSSKSENTPAPDPCYPVKDEFSHLEQEDYNDYLEFNNEDCTSSYEKISLEQDRCKDKLDTITSSSHLLMSPNDLEVNVSSMPHLKCENTAIKQEDKSPANLVTFKNAFLRVKAQPSIVNSTKKVRKTKPDLNSQLEKVINEKKRSLKYRMQGQQYKREQKLSFKRVLNGKEKTTYKCNYEGCGKEYVTRHRLREHLMYHRDDKPFLCPWPNCAWKFTRSDVLRRHYKNHVPDIIFKCDFCPKQYTRKDVRDRHVTIHLNQERSFMSHEAKVGTKQDSN